MVVVGAIVVVGASVVVVAMVVVVVVAAGATVIANVSGSLVEPSGSVTVAVTVNVPGAV